LPPTLLHSRNWVLMSAAATVVLVMVWLVGPWSTRRSDADSVPVRTSSQAMIGNPASPNSVDALGRLAQQGDSAAEVALGTRYATGEDVPQSYLDAFHWISQAAQQGNVTAEAMLSTYYETGRGVLPDLVQAYYWALLAQAAGDEGSKARVAS